ncbi:hypothetical protein [Halalkalibacter hemicellulosilyticus]|uniref:Uncharacterized protein n=1 Tax=Halalkalibacter hemicellulosilyticusJCM 9152 TaxID=1236971 RepID=W4QI86_9BACI|nr:hypothetical protein [Halalkalibacter hemicellulosilyticus]GAE31607.1 hypothetical protein JCM9152_3085 [Halalkalibacter hemicellulosilyticusJCM 9152]
MFILSFLPLIVILALLFGLAKVPNYIGGNVMKWLIAGYVAVLFGAIMTYQLIPASEAEPRTPFSDYDDPEMTIFEAIEEDRLEEFEAFVHQRWSFPYDRQDEAFSIRSSSHDYVEYNVFFIEKEEDDGVIDVAYYASDFMINGYPIEDERLHPSLDLIGDELLVRNPDSVEITIAMEEPEFVIRQFFYDQEGFFSGGFGSYTYYENTLVVYVPVDTEIEEGMNVYLIED